MRQLSEPSSEQVSFPSPCAYNIPSLFSPPRETLLRQGRRSGSPCFLSSGRAKDLTPDGMNYCTSHPLMREFDGRQLGPGQYDCPMAMSGVLKTRRP